MCPIVGGNWNNGTNAGVWTLNLNNARGNSNNNVGCRADSVKPRNLLYRYGGAKGDAFRHVVKATAKSVCHCFSGSHNSIDKLIECERQAMDFL
jgi:hypothetical protein